MSREDSLVTTEWAEQNLSTPGLVFVEVDEDTAAYDTGHIPGAVQDQLEDRAAGPGPPRLRRPGRLREAVVRQGHLQRRHRRAVRRQQQLVRRLRLLVLQAVRPPGRQADRRRPQEVGARRPRAGHRGPRPGRDHLHAQRIRTSRSAPCATRSSPRSARRTWSTSARPTSSPASCSPRRTCRRRPRSAPVTSRPR